MDLGVQRVVREILPVLQSWVDQNEKEIDICDEHMEKMLREIYSGRQVECINSSQHKIDYKIKGVNDKMGRLKRKKTLPKLTGKHKMKHRSVALKFMSITGMMMRNMSKTRRALKSKKRKMQNQEITKRKKLKIMKRS